MAFHPIVSRWFRDFVGVPMPAQVRGWSEIQSGRHTLIAAPTGSGKTLAAFLAGLNDLFVEGLESALPDEVRIVYVSPLKALSADVHKNLALPRRGITRLADEAGIDTRRGAHLALSLERLQQVTQRPLVRIGLSATQRPIETVARFLVGAHGDCAIVDEGHRRAIDLQLELPKSALEAVMSHEVWQEYYDRLASLVREHRTTLVFVNTRRLAERLARHLSERLGEDSVTAHHGSLSKDRRLDAETRLKNGQLKALVATASLELGIDIGHVDLVCQIGSPHRIATLLQRVGRSGHTVVGTPKGRLFPVSRDDLVECAALLRAVRE